MNFFFQVSDRFVMETYLFWDLPEEIFDSSERIETGSAPVFIGITLSVLYLILPFPAVLWIQLAAFSFRIRDSHSLWWTVPCPSANLQHTVRCPNPESITTLGLASSAFARHYLRNLG